MLLVGADYVQIIPPTWFWYCCIIHSLLHLFIYRYLSWAGALWMYRGKHSEYATSYYSKEIPHVWVSSEVKILPFQLWAFLSWGSDPWAISPASPWRVTLADTLAADCCSVIHQLGGLSTVICAIWQPALSDTASYGGPEIGVVLMMSLRIWGQAFCPFSFRLLLR